MSRALPVHLPDPEAAADLLHSEDSCFGREYSGSAEECGRCLLPLVVDGRMFLCREVCRSLKERRAGPVVLGWKPGSAEVWDRIRAGDSPADLVRRMVGEDAGREEVREARRILYRRFRYLEKEKDLPVPDLPDVEALLEGI